MTSQARIPSPVKCPSILGWRNARRITPSNSPLPPTATALVPAPKAVMIPASTRSLSCQSALVTWNGIADRSPYAVRPLKLTYVAGVASADGASVIHSGSRRKCRSPPIGTSPRIRGSALKGPHGRDRWSKPACADGDTVRASTATPAGGVATRSPSPRRSEKRPSGHSSRVRPDNAPARRMPRNWSASLNVLRSTAW